MAKKNLIVGQSGGPLLPLSTAVFMELSLKALPILTQLNMYMVW